MRRIALITLLTLPLSTVEAGALAPFGMKCYQLVLVSIIQAQGAMVFRSVAHLSELKQLMSKCSQQERRIYKHLAKE